LFTPTVDGAGHYTGGTWTKVGDQARKRTYHNNAVLQPDGSVLIGGHAPIATGYFQTIDTPDLPGRLGTDNHHDASFQVWQPPYFNDPGRPVVDGVTPAGRTLVVHTADAAHIASVVLMRNTAQTHLVDGDGRTVSLPVLSRGDDTVTVGLPDSTNVLPAGPYLLFANKSKTADLSGRNAADLLPSVGQQLFVTGDAEPGVFVPSAARPATTAAVPAVTHVVPGTAAAHRAPAARVAPAAARPARPASAPATAPELALAADRRRSLPGLPVGVAAGAMLLVGGLLTRRLRRA
ncbi:MAG: galactose oxidase-like domain-containing protein, partial [Mycobacteriales bacterium]